MADIFDKYSRIVERHDAAVAVGRDPLGVVMDEVYSATEASINGRRTILVGTNNYLGITFDPGCIDAAVAALREQGTGSTGSRIANGTFRSHLDLEAAIAAFLQRRSAMVFPTGYQANLGIIAGVAAPGDTIFLDADSHASIYDGCRLSGATVVRFRHNDPEDLDKRLARHAGAEGSKIVIVEGIYSMLGDRAPLREFAEIKSRHGAYLLVDEAHSLGVLGEHGRGAAEEQGVEGEVDFIVGTFSKSLGAIGGFGASDHPRFDVLRFCARPYMFTASASPSGVASVQAALKRIAEHPELRLRLWQNAQALEAGLGKLGFDICSKDSPVIALRMPDEATTVVFWNRLIEHGVYVNLAVPPGTPNQLCLLRCSVSAAHTPEQIEDVCRRFALVAQEMQELARGAAAE
jgi:8-amino-7-oxononanoate synthase